jgi:hypothetical protein
MRFIRIVLGVILCVAGGYLILFEFLMTLTEYHAIDGVLAVIVLSALIIAGIAMFVVGIKLILPRKDDWQRRQLGN